MIESYLTDSITHHAIALDNDNEPTETSTVIKVKLEKKLRKVRSVNGAEVVSQMFFLCPLLDVTYDDKFTVNGVKYSILAIEEIDDFTYGYYRISL